MLLLWQAISAKALQHPPASTQRPIRQRLLRAIRLHRLLAISENGSWALLPGSGTHLARCVVDKANPGYAHWRWTTYGPSVVHLIDFVARQRQLLLTVTVLARGENDAQFKWDSPAVENAAGSSAEGSRASKRSSDGIGKSRESERRFETSPHRQEPETSISCCAEENCGSSASSVGEVEGSTPQKVN